MSKKNRAIQNEPATYTATVLDEQGNEAEVQKESSTMLGVTIEPSKGKGVNGPLGRPVNPNSARQLKLKTMEAKKINGVYIPLGRPVVPGCKRQIQLAELAEKKANGIVAQRGRPKMTEEAKAAARAAREILKAQALKAGYESKVAE